MIIEAAILKEGVIYRGRRHHNIIYDAFLKQIYLKGYRQGFVNEHGQFLDRFEAARNAIECGQITELKYSSFELYSEDLY